MPAQDVAGDELREALKRLKAAGYMELESMTKETSFGCLGCRYRDGNYCKNKNIEATISVDRGCCNGFMPAEGEPCKPEDWAVNRD